MDWGQIGTELALSLLPLLVLVITALIAMAFKYLRQKYVVLNKIQTDDEVEAMAKNIVVALNQSLVDGLKAASEDGKLTPEEIAMVKQQALSTLQLQLTEGQRKVLSTMTSDITTWLANLIEKTVVEHKLEAATASGVLIEANPLEEPTPAVE